MKFSKKNIAGIILAAGSGSRMGKTKQLLPFGKTTLLGRVVENARKSALDEIIVVLGYDADKISQTLDLSNTKVVWNKEYAKGQSTSLIKGLEHVTEPCDSAMFLLGDQPLVNADIINKLIQAFKNCELPIIIPYYRKERGNPVIIARPLFHRLKSLSADTDARAIFDEFKDFILKVQVPDKSIFIDVDTMDDYENLTGSMIRKG